jgi:hypothetical protein
LPILAPVTTFVTVLKAIDLFLPRYNTNSRDFTWGYGELDKSSQNNNKTNGTKTYN